MRMQWRTAALTGFLISALAGCGMGPTSASAVTPTPDASASASPSATGTAGAEAAKPNIVMVLTDDLSLNLLKHIPAAQQMAKEGTSFTEHFVTNSLCCPSRSTIMTGRYSHNTGIYRNHGDTGGYRLFKSKNLDQDTFATDLQKAGYRTAVMGKFLNEYEPGTKAAPTTQNPAGWSEWAISARGYGGYNYDMNVNGEVVSYGDEPKDYMTDVLSRRGQDFIKRAAADEQPFLLEVSTFAPHKPYTPAPRHKKLFKDVTLPHGESYDKKNINPPDWLAPQELSAAQKKKMDGQYRNRLRSVQSVSELITDLRKELERSGVADNTYLVFTADNGYHMGEHSLISGKLTAFDTDIHVPLVVVGPDVPAGQSVDEMTQTIDLRPTFAAMAGTTAPETVDGHSIVPLWNGGTNGREIVLVEHHGPVRDKNDPDFEEFRSANPPDYGAIRAKEWLYVEYVTGEREYYDRTEDPAERKNIAGRLPLDRLAELNQQLRTAEACVGQSSCAAAQAAS